MKTLGFGITEIKYQKTECGKYVVRLPCHDEDVAVVWTVSEFEDRVNNTKLLYEKVTIK